MMEIELAAYGLPWTCQWINAQWSCISLAEELNNDGVAEND